MEASCCAGGWRAWAGFGPSRLLNGPWDGVMVFLLCSRAGIGVADELAVAHAEALLEQRVDLRHRSPCSTGLWRSPAQAPHRRRGPRPNALFSCPISPPPPVVRSPVIGYDLSVLACGEQGQTLAITVVLWRSMARNGEKSEFDGDCHRWTKFAGDGPSFDGKML